MFRRHVLFIRVLNKTLPRTFHASAYSEAVSPKLLSLRVTSPPLPVRLLSCVTQRKVDYLLSMQPVPEKSSASGQQEPRTEQSGTAVRKEPTAGSKKEKKVKKVKSPKKARGRKQKEKESECRDNLLAELPFANTKIWEELGFAGGASDTKKKRKRTEKGRVEGEEDGEKEKKKKKGCPRPNYFVSIPITNQKIKQAVEEVQAEVLQKDPRLSRALIPVGTLHITLLVTHLATQEEVDTEDNQHVRVYVICKHGFIPKLVEMDEWAQRMPRKHSPDHNAATYIKHAVEEAQAEVLQKDPRLSRALIPVGTLQITLLVTHLATQEEVDTAAAALEEMQPTLSALLGGRSLVLPFRGIGHFRQEVAFIQISEGEHLSTLSSIADSVRRAFEEKGISPGDHKDFKPHLTFIKLSRAPKLRRQGIKKLDAALYAAFEQTEFGEESACTLDLCSMLKKKSADGYYHREKTVTFDLLQTTQRTSRKRAKGGPELDDEELMSLSKRLVEDAVFRAVQQYMEETQQNGAAPKDGAPPPLTTNK